MMFKKRSGRDSRSRSEARRYRSSTTYRVHSASGISRPFPNARSYSGVPTIACTFCKKMIKPTQVYKILDGMIGMCCKKYVALA